MSWFEVILLAVIQGISEFLPISSSGHLLVTELLLGTSGDLLFFNVMLHLASGVAILIVLWKDVIEMFRSRKMLLLVVISTIPVVLVGLLIKDYMNLLEEYMVLVGIGLLLTSFFNFMVDRLESKKEHTDLTIMDAIVIGVFQTVALLPGVSRSGSTITGASITKLSRVGALKYSFLLALPAIFGASSLELYDYLQTGDAGGITIVQILLGTVVCFVVSILTIRWFLNHIKQISFKYFAIYTLILGGVIVFISLY